MVASKNNYEEIVSDIKNAYLYVDCDIQVCPRVGVEFVEASYKELPEGSLAKLVQALYKLHAQVDRIGITTWLICFMI